MGGVCTKTESPTAPKKDPKIFSAEINGIVYEVINGDMCYEHVDAIVNSANAQLNHNTGVSGSIVMKGGSEIQVESTKIVQENGSLTVGDVVSTGSGKLNCKFVLHAVLPIWIGGEINEEAKLVDALKNTLVKAEELKITSLAFPALGGGVFGFPRDLAAEITVHNCLKYFEENPTSTLKLIKFMNFDLPTLKFFEHELRKHQDKKNSEFKGSIHNLEEAHQANQEETMHTKEAASSNHEEKKEHEEARAHDGQHHEHDHKDEKVVGHNYPVENHNAKDHEHKVVENHETHDHHTVTQESERTTIHSEDAHAGHADQDNGVLHVDEGVPQEVA